MKVRVRRVADTVGIGTCGMDTGFIPVSIIRLPMKGERITFAFERLSQGVWSTMPIVSVKTRPGVKIYSTESGSEYHIKKGWK